MTKIKISLTIILTLICIHLVCQVKTLIPKDDEVNFTINDQKKIGLTTTFDETKIEKEKIVELFASQIGSTMNPEYYYMIDSGRHFIEMFIVYPCKSFNLTNIQSHEIINEGIITSTLYIDFKDEEYEIDLRDFDWVNRKKESASIDKLYKSYLSNKDLRHKVKYYGVLKSAELSIAETLSNITVVIDEIMKFKSKM